MSIHSMPNNKKFEDNYDRIFARAKAKRLEAEKRVEKALKEKAK